MEEVIIKALKCYQDELISLRKALTKHRLRDAGIHVDRELNKVGSAIKKFNDPDTYVSIKTQGELME